MTSMSLVLVVLWLILEFSGYKSKKHIKLDMTYSARLVKKFRFQISKRSLVMLEKTRNLETLILKKRCSVASTVRDPFSNSAEES